MAKKCFPGGIDLGKRIKASGVDTSDEQVVQRQSVIR